MKLRKKIFMSFFKVFIGVKEFHTFYYITQKTLKKIINENNSLGGLFNRHGRAL